MPKYVIERSLPGAGKLSPDQLQEISAKSVAVLRNLGPELQWFPADAIARVSSVIDPITGEG